MKTQLFTIICLTFITLSFAQKKQAYVIYNAKGKKVSYKKMLKHIQDKEVILFGELHNNPIAHWLQIEVTKDLNTLNNLILGAEMFEADNQQPLNDYLEKKIDARALDTLARLWPNYKTDYAPLVNFAKTHKLPFVATNIPRRYAKMVYRKGFDTLNTVTPKEKNWIAPLPIAFDSELPTYKNILKMMGSHGSPKLVKAQAIKDATMGYFISKNMQANTTFLHFNGAYHSDHYEGILWYLKRENNTLDYTTISTVSQEDIFKLEKDHKGKADFIICVDKDMTTTY
ncbi:MAG: ChaN family lipoprotein [Flavobacteriaceae bacterium]|nr:ChaN family lipoprotein [Flavobacteriaceae bacterium]